MKEKEGKGGEKKKEITLKHVWELMEMERGGKGSS